jgi:hypothetical protein
MSFFLTQSRERREDTFTFLPRFYFVCIICKGDPYPAQRGQDFLCLGLARGQFPLSLSTYLFGVNGRINENKTNKRKKGRVWVNSARRARAMRQTATTFDLPTTRLPIPNLASTNLAQQ